MGLFIYRVKFDSAPPSEAALRAEVTRQTGSASDLDDFVVNDNIVEITAGLNPITGPYALKALLDLGGTYVDFRTLEPRAAQLPDYVRKPWREWHWWKRFGVHAHFHLGLLSTAIPKNRREGTR